GIREASEPNRDPSDASVRVEKERMAPRSARCAGVPCTPRARVAGQLPHPPPQPPPHPPPPQPPPPHPLPQPEDPQPPPASPPPVLAQPMPAGHPVLPPPRLPAIMRSTRRSRPATTRNAMAPGESSEARCPRSRGVHPANASVGSPTSAARRRVRRARSLG